MHLYTIIYDFFITYVFTHSELDAITYSGLSLTMNEWLGHTCTIVLIGLGVLWLIFVVRWIFRVFAGLLKV